MEKRDDPEKDGGFSRDDSNTEKRPRRAASEERTSPFEKRASSDTADASSPFLKDKRPRIRRVTEQINERTPRPRFERETEERTPYKSESRQEEERRPYGYRSDEERRPYERRFDRREADERPPYERRDDRPREDRFADRRTEGPDRRRSYNPNFDEENRLRRPAPRGERYESSEEDNRFNSYRYDRDDRPRWDNRERPPREYRPARDSGGYAPHYDRNDRPRYPRDERQGSGRYDNRNGGERPRYDRKPSRNNQRGGEKRKTNPFKTPKGGYDSEFKPKVYPAYAAANIVEPIRLNKFISMSGLCSRREADEFIREGNVTVNGVVITEMGVKINPTDTVHCNGELLQGEKRVYILMNKPKGFVTTVEDPNADRTVMDIVKNACRERVYPVGRLDKNSLGVLMITNDGELTKRLTHPSHDKKKVYQVTLDRAANPEDLEKLYVGIPLDDGVAKADEVEFLDEKRREVGITIHTGRNRIVRRMFEELGYHVQKLDRVYFAGLTKKGLRRGAWRYLTPKEVAMIKSGKYE